MKVSLLCCADKLNFTQDKVKGPKGKILSMSGPFLGALAQGNVVCIFHSLHFCIRSKIYDVRDQRRKVKKKGLTTKGFGWTELRQHVGVVLLNATQCH